MSEIAEKPRASRPDIYGYHDYREFLRDLFAFRKENEPGFSLRSLCRDAKIASGYLPMVLSVARTLSTKAMAKLARPLGLSSSEQSYFELLRTVADSDSQEVRMEALSRIQRFRSYRALNPKEIEVYRYLTHWYYVAIREMAALPGFRPEAEWIQERLRYKVPLKEIEQALQFLLANNYVEAQPDGTVRLPEKDIRCVGGVYRIALAAFHGEMLNLAKDALISTPAEERNVTGHTVAVGPEQFEKVRAILDEALTRIAELPAPDAAENVYHITLAAFPLTKSEAGRVKK